MKEVIKKVTREVKIYFSNDGKEFDTKEACVKYEERLRKDEAIDGAEKLRIKELDNLMPITACEENENNTFRWYRIENETDFKTVSKACETRYWNTFGGAKKYPEIMCVETCGEEPYEDDAYCYYLSDLIDESIGFWKKLGYKIEIKE